MKVLAVLISFQFLLISALAQDKDEECKIIKEIPFQIKCPNSEGYLKETEHISSIRIKINDLNSQHSSVLLDNISTNEIVDKKILQSLIEKKLGYKIKSYHVDQIFISPLTPIFNKDNKLITGCEFRASPMLIKYKSDNKCNKVFCVGPAVCGSADEGEYQFYMACEGVEKQNSVTCPRASSCFYNPAFENIDETKIDFLKNSDNSNQGSSSK